MNRAQLEEGRAQSKQLREVVDSLMADSRELLDAAEQVADEAARLVAASRANRNAGNPPP